MKLIKKDMINDKYNEDGPIDGMEASPDVYIQLLGDMYFERMLKMKTGKGEIIGKFEDVNLIDNGQSIFTEDNPIHNIQFEYDLGFEQVTLHFGNYGHIHLPQNEFKKLLDGLNWLQNKMIKLNECEKVTHSKDKKKRFYLKLNGNYWLPDKKREVSCKEEKIKD